MQRKYAIVLSVFVLSITIFSFVRGSAIYWNDSSLVKKGLLDLQDINFEHSGIMSLNGKWEFYPNKLIDPGDFQHGDVRKKYMQVPGKWDHHFTGDGIQTGTYRLTILVPQDGTYGIKVNSVRHASKLFINGNEAGGLGTPSSDQNRYKYREGKYMAFGQSINKRLEVVIHVANRQVPNGGIVKPIAFGEAEQIMLSTERSRLLDGFIVGGYFLLAMIFFFHYIHRKKTLNELYFAVFCLFQGVYVSTQNEKMIYFFFPQIPNEILLSIQLSFVTLSVLFFLLFINDLFPVNSNKRITRTLVILLLTMALYYSVPYKPWGWVPVYFAQIYTIGTLGAAFGYMLFILVRAFLSRLKGSEYILVAATSFVCYGIALSLELLFEIDVSQIPLLLFLVMSLSLSFFIGYRRQLIFHKIDELSKELLVQDQLKNDFLVKASKELKEPLEGIVNVATTLMEGKSGPLKKEQQELMYVIHASGKKSLYLADHLHNAGSDPTQLKIHIKPVDLHMIHAIADELKLFINSSKNVMIKNEIPLHLPFVLADENSLKQVIFQLLYNAVKYTEAGKITLSAAMFGNKMHFTVEDTGIGIESEHLKRIFDSFYQVPHKTLDGSKGIGLGLTIAKQLVLLMDGDIWAESVPGKGSCFTFTLPIYEGKIEAAAALESTKSDIVGKGQVVMDEQLLQDEITYSKRILLVDADERHLLSMKNILLEHGYEAIACSHSSTALQLLQNKRMDIAVIDVKMPDMSGLELSKKIRKKFDLVELPIIILSSSGDHSLLSSQAGVNHVIQKPFGKNELISKIRSLLAIKDAVQQSVLNELKYYYAQITPHFLYNTLNTIIGLSYKDQEQTREALEHLSVYFRAKLDFQKYHSVVSLEEEIELVQSYVAIEKLRFGNRLSVHYDIDPNIDIELPAMTIQPLVENAIQHGLAQKNEGGTLWITVKKDGNIVKLVIEDNGTGIAEEKQKQLLHDDNRQIGFKNPFYKLKLMKNSTFQLFSKEGKGTKIIITLQQETE